ncbi:MAG: CocE/NonD family hydrolase [Actinomycetota bacterium]
MKPRRSPVALPVLLVLLALGSAGLAPPAGAQEAAYTTLIDVRVAMDDGVRLAADVYVPAGPDADGDGLYPCVVELTPYRKENRAAEGASYLPGQGIALIEVDARGTGGSEGEYDIVFSVREQADAVQWIDWAATTATRDGAPLRADGRNKLCERTVGMYGGSYSGIIQYLVASLPARGRGDVPAASRYLAAVAPQRAYGDLYRDIVYHGGIAISSFGAIWTAGTNAYYTQPPTDVASAEGQAAWTDHLTKNDPMLSNYLEHPYVEDLFSSDDTDRQWTQRLYADSSTLPRIQNLRVPTLHLAGWFDAFTQGQLEVFSRAHQLERRLGKRGPNFLIVGPWNHSGTHFINPNQGFREHLGQWYRYWLEGRAAGASQPRWVARGFDGRGARAHYFSMRSGVVNAQGPGDGAWMNAPTWPPPRLDVRRWYLRAGGELSPEPPGSPETADTYLYDPAAGTAEALSRWDNAAGTPHPAWDQRTDGPKGLTYTTAPFERPLSVAGPISMRLTASTTGLPLVVSAGAGDDWPGAAQMVPPYHDTDWIVKVSDVAPDGTATLLTAGYLRASHRAHAPRRGVWIDGQLVAPYHLHTAARAVPPAIGQALDYEIGIWPTAKVFAPGHRLRIDLYSADTPNHLALLKPALNTVFHDPGRLSYLSIPVAP